MKNVLQKTKVAIQGVYGAFHDMAAIHYFGKENTELIAMNTFSDVFMSLRQGMAEYGILAIENSIAGSILPNYALLRESGMKISGEIYLKIEQNLLALPGQTIADITEVYSHPMAILQCQEFFKKYPQIKLIDSLDTALSAKIIEEKGLPGTGAIASEYAAERYHLQILARGIQDHDVNYTRFLIVGRNGLAPRHMVNKASLHFALAHRIGSLAKVLSILSYFELNLTKIQSLPIAGKEWEYQFYADVVFDDYTCYQQALEAIGPFTSGLGILGEYIKGETVC